ncbi:3,5-dihydroxyphenylacetyl-CoA synthase DpgA [Nonomuraea sp. NPDC050556]|uniref:3,5-dihydroxyphenylacetyl-CoA synthase DpgA n=1 Tax=Nonomuraea sp. NPDC050556 TaxID=3364369 RepID=UPI00378B3AF8
MDATPRPTARLMGVGTATSPDCYSQMDLLDRYGITDLRIRSMFLNSHIERRFLNLPEPGPNGQPLPETQGQLLDRHRSQGLVMAAEALRRCLESIGATLDDVRFLACVSSTGWLTPGFTALLIKHLDMRRDCGRLDVVGMGCNAGLNGLNPVATWAESNPGQLAVMLCVEVCSAAYVFDGTMRTAVVNSLFGDGAAAVAVRAGEPSDASAVERSKSGPALVGYARHLITDAVDAMRYDWDENHGKFSFFLDRDVPYVVGAHVERVIDELLGRAGLQRSAVRHWLVHPGGKKVIDAVRVNLGLTINDLRHTMAVLRSYGNVSSASFLFAYHMLQEEASAIPGDIGVMMAMGPGSTIEAALLRW